MIVLCSNGLSSDCLLSAVGRRVKLADKAVLVVTADHVYKEKNYQVNRCMDELERLGAVASVSIWIGSRQRSSGITTS